MFQVSSQSSNGSRSLVGRLLSVRRDGRKVRRVLLLGVLLGTGLGLQGASADVVDGNPVLTDHHQVALNTTVALKYSKQDPCNSSPNYGPPCSVLKKYIGISVHNWDGVPNDSVRVGLCNLRVVTPPVGGGAQDGIGDVRRGCDHGNVLSSSLDSNGACCTGGFGFYLQMPSSQVLSESAYPECYDFGNPNHYITGCNTQPEAVCPPTPGAIAGGWTCVVEVSDPDTAGQPTHAGYRHVYLRSPVPAMACGGHACPQFIPTGTQVTVTGVQFPCKVIRPDDTVATPNVYDGACVTKWTNKTILIQRLSPKGIVATVTPTSQTSGLDGSYSITFTMPSVPAGGQYKIIPASPGCSLPCDSGNFRAAGKFFVHQ